MNALIASFQAGEMSPLLEGRGDLEATRSGCLRLRNMIPMKLGPALQRPGTLFLGTVHNEEKRVCVLGYVFSQSVSYRIELGEEYARFWLGEAPVTTQPGLTEAADGVISPAGEALVLKTPWTADEVFELQVVSANDVVWLCHRKHWPRRLRRFGEQDWRIDRMPVVFPPLRDANAKEITLEAAPDPELPDDPGAVTLTATGGDVFDAGDTGGYYGISHRRDLPMTEISLSQGSSQASALLSITAAPEANDTLTIGDVVYKFVNTFDAANQIKIHAVPATMRNYILAAISGTASEGVSPGTLSHPKVTAVDAGPIPSGQKATATLTAGFRNLQQGAEVKVDGFTFTTVWGATTDDQKFTIGASPEATLDAFITVANAKLTSCEFAPRAGSSTVLTAVEAGTEGNEIVINKNTGSPPHDVEFLRWSHTPLPSTLKGGTDTETQRIRITPRANGKDGNGIVVNSTADGCTWNGTVTAGGTTIYIPSDITPAKPLGINGGWEVFTYGKWYGTLKLQIERAPDVWETLRAWDSKNDFNAQSSGIVDGQRNLRLAYEGTGHEADGAEPRATLSALDAMVTGVVKIKEVINAQQARGMVVKPLHSTDKTYDWAEGAWSDRRGYPAAVALHEQRLMFGRDKVVWASQVSGFDNFQRLALEDASFAYSLAAAQGNEILALLSHRGLVVLTDGDEWLLDGGPQSAAITPSQLRAERKSGYGSAKVPPVLMLTSVFFVQQGGQRLNEYVFDFQQDGYEAVDLTELAEHLGAETFVSMAWAQNPHGVLWAVTSGGSLLSMTYRRKAGIIAWAKHETPRGAFESVAVTPGADGISDVWVTVRRSVFTPGPTPVPRTVRTVERFDTAHWSKVHQGSGDKGWINMADGAVVRTVPEPEPGDPPPVLTAEVDGLDHLEKCTVGVLVDGSIHPDRVVENGKITLAAPFAESVVAGLPPVAELQPMPLEMMMQDGAATGRKFRTGRADVRFYRTGACEYADREDAKFYPVAFRAAADASNAPVPPFTGLKKLDNAGSYGDSTRVMLRNRTMLPLHVLSMVLETTIHGD